MAHFYQINLFIILVVVKFTIFKAQSTSSQECLAECETNRQIVSLLQKQEEALQLYRQKFEDSSEKEKKFYSDCSDLHRNSPGSIEGVHSFQTLGGKRYKALCDQDGWTYIQRRFDGSVSFNRFWYAYKHGFGDVNGEHWLGNDNIYEITNQQRYKLSIDFSSWEPNPEWFTRTYDNFYIENEAGKYRLHFSGTSSGNVTDSFSYHKYMFFSTPDRDNDKSQGKCSPYSGFWLNNCAGADLNGLYWIGGTCGIPEYSGIEWESLSTSARYPRNKYSFKTSSMKIKPMN